MLNPPTATIRDRAVAVPLRTMRSVLNDAFRYRRAALAILLACMLLGILAAVLVPPTYKSQARLLALSAGLYDMQAENGVAQTAQVLNPTDVANVEIQLLESAELHRTVARRELGAGATGDAVAKRAAQLDAALHVTKATDANVVELSYTDRSPQAAARTLRTILDSYFAARAEVLTSGRLGFLSNQLAKAQADLDAVDAQIVGVQRQNNVVDINAQVAGAVQQVNDLSKARMDAQAALAESRRAADTLRRGAGRVPQQVELYSDNAEAARSLGEMQTSLLQLRGRRADFASRYMAESPQVQQLDKQIAGMEAAIARQSRDLITTRRVGRNQLYDTARDRLTQVEASAAGNAARQSVIGGQEAAATARMTQLIDVSDTLAKLRLQRDILTDSVRSIAARVEQARIQQNQAANAGSTNVRVVEAPSPPDRRSNPTLMFVAAGLVSGIALAGIAIVVLASLRTTYLAPEEAACALDLPVLPVGANEAAKRRAYGELAATVDADGGSTTLLLSPASRQDLQNAAMGLGLALGRRAMGRVALLRFADGAAVPDDAGGLVLQDWRGLATTVIGADACVRRGIAAALLRDLRQRFEHIIVTAPPADRSHDCLALATIVDKVALVVRADATPDAHARALVASLRDRGGDPVGVLLIGVRDYMPAWLGSRLGGTQAV